MYKFSLALFLLSSASALPTLSSHDQSNHNHYDKHKRTLTPDNTCGGTNAYTCNPNDAYGGRCCSASGWCGKYLFSMSIVTASFAEKIHRKLRYVLRDRMSVSIWKLRLLWIYFSFCCCISAICCHSGTTELRTSSIRQFSSTEQRRMHVGGRRRRQLYPLADLRLLRLDIFPNK